MPPFNRSSLTYTQAQTEVAAAAGASTTEMLARAGNSLDAVAQKWNRLRWKFLQTDQIIALTAPISVTGCTTTLNSTTVSTTVASGFDSVLVDDYVAGAGLRPESLVSALGATAGATSLTTTVAASATVTGATLTFHRILYPVSADYKTIFDVRIVGSPRQLYYQPRRNYDREVIDQSSTSEPYGYDLYYIGGKGKLRILPPPAGAETLWVKYYRRMSMPSSIASASGIDLPEDYEDIFIAAAKAHFLADKGQAFREQWFYWDKYAAEGIKEMRRDERLVEDEDLALQPPLPRRVYGVNSPFYWTLGES